MILFNLTVHDNIVTFISAVFDQFCLLGHRLDETDGIAHELSDGDTCLDIASLDAQSSRKMRDDSKSHHISDDVLFKPKRRVRFLYVDL